MSVILFPGKPKQLVEGEHLHKVSSLFVLSYCRRPLCNQNTSMKGSYHAAFYVRTIRRSKDHFGKGVQIAKRQELVLLLPQRGNKLLREIAHVPSFSKSTPHGFNKLLQYSDEAASARMLNLSRGNAKNMEEETQRV